MEQIKKDKLIHSIKTISISVMVLFILAACLDGLLVLLNLITLGASLFSGNSIGAQEITFIHSMIQYSIFTVIFIISAVIFYRASYESTPLCKKNVKSLNAIAVLLLISGCMPSGLYFIDDTDAQLKTELPFLDFPTGFFLDIIIISAGIVMLLLAKMLEYGLILQQESDETL